MYNAWKLCKGSLASPRMEKHRLVAIAVSTLRRNVQLKISRDSSL